MASSAHCDPDGNERCRAPASDFVHPALQSPSAFGQFGGILRRHASARRAVSSAGQSASFTPRKSGVRVPHRPPPLTHEVAPRGRDRRAAIERLLTGLLTGLCEPVAPLDIDARGVPSPEPGLYLVQVATGNEPRASFRFWPSSVRLRPNAPTSTRPRLATARRGDGRA
jgi:hypothetical protein